MRLQVNDSPFSGYANGQEVTCVHCTTAGASGGAAYVRYGATECPAGQSLVYSGILGGSHSTRGSPSSHFGGGANLLCLSTAPEFLTISSGTQSTAWLYRVEYEFSESPCACARLLCLHVAG